MASYSPLQGYLEQQGDFSEGDYGPEAGQGYYGAGTNGTGTQLAYTANPGISGGVMEVPLNEGAPQSGTLGFPSTLNSAQMNLSPSAQYQPQTIVNLPAPVQQLVPMTPASAPSFTAPSTPVVPLPNLQLSNPTISGSNMSIPGGAQVSTQPTNRNPVQSGPMMPLMAPPQAPPSAPLQPQPTGQAYAMGPSPGGPPQGGGGGPMMSAGPSGTPSQPGITLRGGVTANAPPTGIPPQSWGSQQAANPMTPGNQITAYGGNQVPGGYQPSGNPPAPQGAGPVYPAQNFASTHAGPVAYGTPPQTLVPPPKPAALQAADQELQAAAKTLNDSKALGPAISMMGIQQAVQTGNQLIEGSTSLPDFDNKLDAALNAAAKGVDDKWSALTQPLKDTLDRVNNLIGDMTPLGSEGGTPLPNMSLMDAEQRKLINAEMDAVDGNVATNAAIQQIKLEDQLRGPEPGFSRLRVIGNAINNNPHPLQAERERVNQPLQYARRVQQRAAQIYAAQGEQQRRARLAISDITAYRDGLIDMASKLNGQMRENLRDWNNADTAAKMGILIAAAAKIKAAEFADSAQKGEVMKQLLIRQQTIMNNHYIRMDKIAGENQEIKQTVEDEQLKTEATRIEMEKLKNQLLPLTTDNKLLTDTMNAASNYLKAAAVYKQQTGKNAKPLDEVFKDARANIEAQKAGAAK